MVFLERAVLGTGNELKSVAQIQSQQALWPVGPTKTGGNGIPNVVWRGTWRFA